MRHPSARQPSRWPPAKTGSRTRLASVPGIRSGTAAGPARWQPEHVARKLQQAALPSAIYFTTKGASQELKARVLAPQVVRFDPANGAQNVSTAVTELRVTFSLPMGGGFSWCTAGDDDHDFPKGPAGKGISWSEDKMTCVLPVELKANMTYRLSLNDPEHKNFQSDAGVPLEPAAYTFKTSDKP